MNEVKRLYQNLHNAIDNNEMEDIVSFLGEVDEMLKNPSLREEERRWMLEQSQECFQKIEEKYQTLQHLLVDMNVQNKIAKKYEQD